MYRTFACDLKFYISCNIKSVEGMQETNVKCMIARAFLLKWQVAITYKWQRVAEIKSHQNMLTPPAKVPS